MLVSSFGNGATGTDLQIVPLVLTGFAMVWLVGCDVVGRERSSKTGYLQAAVALLVGVAHVVVQVLGVRAWFPDTVERAEGMRIVRSFSSRRVFNCCLCAQFSAL